VPRCAKTERETVLFSNGSNSGANALSLRLRLIGLVAVVFALSLALGGTVACLNASRSVQAEMRSALAVAQQTIATAVTALGRSEAPRRDLEQLIASFQANRHVRVRLDGEASAGAPAAFDAPPSDPVPAWFVRLIGVPPSSLRIPIIVAGQDYGAITVETAPHNEILEIWNEFGDSLLILVLFSLPTMLLIYFFIGHALRPLDRLAAALGSIGRGDYGVRLAGRLPPELSRLRDSFNRTAGQLAGMAAENRRLNEQLLGLQEQERAELARDLHDEIGPSLFAINIDAANISRQVREGRLAPIADHVASITEAVGHLQRQVKSMLGRLRPIGLAEFGLIEAIGNLIEFWRRRHPEIAYALELAPEAEGRGDLIDTTIYRVVQECLSNAIRHSRPTAISVRVDFDERDHREALVVTVADDGQGMGADPRIGYGLRGMSERVKAMGGSLTVASSPGAGLVVTASLPRARVEPEPAGTLPAEVA
jgi:two-component system, NarL family, sensor histidine kinase UhpB